MKLLRVVRGLLKANPSVYWYWKRVGQYPDYLYWRIRGQPQRSPHWLKQRCVKDYARRFGIRTLIETGTYYGEMVTATAKAFRRIYTIEYDRELYELSQRKLAALAHVSVIHGDSEVVIPELLRSIGEPCLFWLDAGYFGWANVTGKPSRLSTELQAILTHRITSHVVLIDDARGLNGQGDAPPASVSPFPSFAVPNTRTGSAGRHNPHNTSTVLSPRL